MIAGEGFHPVLVVGGALAQDLLADDRYADHLTEKMHDLLGPREPAEVAVNDNAVEAVVDEGQQIAEPVRRRLAAGGRGIRTLGPSRAGIDRLEQFYPVVLDTTSARNIPAVLIGDRVADKLPV